MGKLKSKLACYTNQIKEVNYVSLYITTGNQLADFWLSLQLNDCTFFTYNYWQPYVKCWQFS